MARIAWSEEEVTALRDALVSGKKFREIIALCPDKSAVQLLRKAKSLNVKNGVGSIGNFDGLEDTPASRDGRVHEIHLWNAQELAIFKDLFDHGSTPMYMMPHLPGKTYAQILRRYRTIKEAKRMQMNAGIPVRFLGLHLGDIGRPTEEMLADRDARQDAEYAQGLESDPNHVILGDPSPQRLALARAADEAAKPRKPTLPRPMSAVKVPTMAQIEARDRRRLVSTRVDGYMVEGAALPMGISD
jgi:hypothetical protein